MSVSPNTPEQAEQGIIVHCGGIYGRQLVGVFYLVLTALEALILKRAMVSVSFKLLSLNLWIVLIRWPERTVNKAEVFQHMCWRSRSRSRSLWREARYVMRREVSHILV